ncbi:MAG: ferrous iron transporter B [Candidatus Omnitrophica bacterium]|nr:ferrous iron transporter B [Candidatus Omnitrophota bacterium]
MLKKIFLIGNPNVGKSVVFSRLTGVRVISSNYAGTTVDIMKGFLKSGEEEIEVIDLPGTYSIEPSSKAEEVAVSLLKGSPRDEFIVINIVDSTNLERNLFLTLQLIEEGLPVVVSLNMCDDAKHRGVNIDIEKLEKLLGVPVVATCAITGFGIKMLIDRFKEAKPVARNKLTHRELWQEIGNIIEQVQQLTHRHHTLRELLEDASVRPFSGMLMAIAVTFISFQAVRFIGEWLIDNVSNPVFFKFYEPLLWKLSRYLGEESFIHHLLIGDLLDGKIDFQQSLGLLTTAPYIEFAMVLPYIVSFYLILSLLEDIGILPRLAMLMDNILHRLGLHGFAIIPVLLGLGCNVPGILATRNLESRRERFIAATLISIGVPCAALQAMIFGLLGKFSGFYVTGVYLVLFLVWLVLGVLLNRVLKGVSPELLVEIPPYRIPSFAILWHKLFLRIKGFLIEAIPVVMLGVLIVNILLYFRLFEQFSLIFAPVVKGIFGLPKESAIALIMGFFRKDVAVGMLMPLGLSIKQLFIACVLLAVSFPCVATFVIMFRELGWKDFLKSCAIMLMAMLAVGASLNFVLPH